MMQDKPIVYLVATLCGFATYFVLSNLIGIDYAISLFLGFVGAHAGLLLGRRFLN